MIAPTADIPPTDLGRTIQVEVPPVAGSIAIARSVVRRTVIFRDDHAHSSFLLAVTEILANAIDEHDRLGLGTAITATIESDDDGVAVVRIGDVGDGFDPTDRGSGVDEDGRPSDRGRGIALAEAFVPGLTFESGPAGTVASLPLAGMGIVR